MRVLSLFDGISCARVALSKLNIPVEAYYASEIDKYAIQVSQKNWRDIEHIGNIEWLRGEYFAKQGIDLLIGGSPCQDLSIAKAGRQGLSGTRSGLFYEYVRLLKEVKPKYFILENVASMSKEAKAEITKIMGVEPIMIDAALVGAQQRKRLFWTNIPGVTQPTDRGIILKDILESGEVDRDKAYCIDANYYKGTSKTLSANGGGWGAKTGLYMIQRGRGFNKGGIKALDGKTPTLTSSAWEHNNHLVKIDGEDIIIRKLTPVECERLQAVPDGYTDGVSNTQRYKTLGNAFNADVIAHILSFIP